MPSEEIYNDRHLRQLPILINDENPEKKAKEILDKIAQVNQKLAENQERTSSQSKSNSKSARNEDAFEQSSSAYQNQNLILKNDLDELGNEAPKGQYIKRKIVQRISYLMPNPMLQNSSPFIQANPQIAPTYTTTNDDSISTYPLDSFDTRQNSQHQYFQTPNSIEQSQYIPTNKQFQWPWPLAQFFPVLIKDPFLSVMNGFTGIIEYGPQADVCTKEINKNSKKSHKNTRIIDGGRQGKSLETKPEQNPRGIKLQLFPTNTKKASQTINSSEVQTLTNMTSDDGTNKVFNPFVKTVEKEDDFKRVRFPQFNSVKSTPDVVDKPGFFINRLRVRKGGVAIAGPGGIATAGGGGTAIVGPEGVAYTKPDGTVIAGPGAKVVALPQELNLNRLIEKLSKHRIVDPQFEDSDSDTSLEGEYVPKEEGNNRTKRIFIPKGARIVATGPAIYRHPKD